MNQDINEIINYLIDEDLKEFKCFDLLKQKLRDDSSFIKIINEGISKGLIKKFPRDLFNRVCDQNLRAPFKPIQIFMDGANIGNCTIMSKMISYSLDNCNICGGTLTPLMGSNNSPDGRHTWISSNGFIIDPSLMIQISEQYMEQLGYKEENRYNPSLDHIYLASKKFANDTGLKNNK